ncbi:hypothetical protein LO762_15200 [Actinocorallia sp. API 0066]|uniref:hypothetical protein n=1 Tax=Actinocorallia sp. API 0066 TaxID=2896846 RepID=UPI001E54308E|nr:hypothetical protein [Actinocorallia sp. API 0066]MCD0450526.1 hypothetical protein [Actinocorallia sp. API 0066]
MILEGTISAARLAACLLVVLLVLNGCSDDASGEPEDAEPPLGPVSVITRDEAIRLPLDHFSPNLRETDDIIIAEQFLARGCMDGFGLTYPTRPRRHDGYSIITHPGLFGLIDPARARHGYGPGAGRSQPSRDLPSTRPTGPNEHSPTAEPSQRSRDLPSARPSGPDGHGLGAGWEGLRPLGGAGPPTEAEEDVWLGRVPEYGGIRVPDGGCLAEGRRKLGGTSDLHWPRTELQAEAVKLAEEDPRTVEVTARWAACMRQVGYPYQTPGSVASDARWLVPGPPSPAEVLVASADVSCKARVNYAGLRLAVLTAHEMRLVNEHKERLTAHKLELSARLRNAREVLARTGADTF